MTVRIGKVELIGVQDIHTEETRNLVEQRVPDQKGSVFQDLGRDPVTVVILGLLFGSEVLSNLEQLRQAQEKAEPLPFAADIAIGTELTEVIIEDLKMRQLAGYVDRYRFALRVREHVERPESPEKALAVVNDGIAADADAFAEDSIAAAGALQDPANLANLLADNPGALAQMSADDLAGAVADHADKLTPDAVGGILKSVGVQDPAKMGGMLDSLQKKGALGGLMAKFAEAGKDLKEMLKDVKLTDVVKTIVTLFSAGVELIRTLNDLAGQIEAFGADFKFIISDPAEFLKALTNRIKQIIEELRHLIGAVKSLVAAVNRIVNVLEPMKDKLLEIAEKLNSKAALHSTVTAVVRGLETIEGALSEIADQLVQLAGAAVLLGLTKPLLKGGSKLIASSGRFIEGVVSPTAAGDAQEFVNKIVQYTKSEAEAIVDFGEQLLETGLDSDIVSLKNEFSRLRHSIAELTAGI
jgi:hypothetical protein